MTKSFHVILMYVTMQLGLVFFLYPGDMIESATAGHWVPIVIGFAVYLFFFWVYMKGMNFKQGLDITDLYMRMGKIMAAILLLPVFIYLIIESSITIRAYAEILTIVFLANTPLWAIMLLLLSIPAYLALKGVKAIFGTSVLVSCFGFPLVLFICIASFQNADWNYVFPLIEENMSFVRRESYYRSFFLYTGSFLFLGFVQPYYKYHIRAVLIAAICMLPIILSSVYVPILTFGEATAATFFFPFVVTLDVIQINWLMFERVAVFFLLSLISLIMLFLAMVIWQTVRISGRFLPQVRTGYLILVVAGMIFAISLMIPSWESIEILFNWVTWVRFYILCVVPITVYFLGRQVARET